MRMHTNVTLSRYIFDVTNLQMSSNNSNNRLNYDEFTYIVININSTWRWIIYGVSCKSGSGRDDLVANRACK